MSDHSCPLCLSPKSEHFFEDKKRRYLRCTHCALVFVPKQYWLSEEEEKAEYDKHDNDPNDLGYRKFLSRLHDPMIALLAQSSNGMDFGCGPGPALAQMFQERGHNVALYDKFFYPDETLLDEHHHQYDFISTTEVVEHLHEPAKVLDQLWRLLKPGGYLGVMTKLVIDQPAFSTWHYKNDPTHICFFSKPTLQWLANKWHAELEFFAADAFVFRKPRL